MIKIFVDHQQIDQALQIYENMLQEGFLPNMVTFVTLLSTCTDHGYSLVGKHIHASVNKTDFKSDGFIETALISMYGRCKKLENALNVFDGMEHYASESWNATLSAYAICEESCKTLQLYCQMLCECVLPSKLSLLTVLSTCGNLGTESEGKRLHARIIIDDSQPNVEVQNALVSMYTKFGNIDEAHRIYSGISCRTRISWNTLIAMYVEHSRNECALQVFVQMWREHIIPDKSAFTSTLTACANQAALTDGSLIHAWIVEENLNGDGALNAALLDMYGKCGCIYDAWALFQGELNHDIVLWTLIIAAHAQHGKGWQAITLLEKMQLKGVSPNSITFLNVIIACSHAGLVNEGILCLMSMTCDYGIKLSDDHMACMINLLGKAGRMNEAKCLLYGLQHDAMVVSLVSLVSAYKSQLDVEQGEKAAKLLIEVNPKNTAPYVLLSNLYMAEEMAILEPD